MVATEAHPAPPQRPRGARVERKGRFTITEITPGSPHEASAFHQDGGTPQFDDGGTGAAAAYETAALNQAFADTVVVVQQPLQQDLSQLHPQQQQHTEVSSPQLVSMTTTPVLQPQSPEEGDLMLDKAALAVAVAVLQSASPVDASPVVIDPVVEPEPAPPVATVEIYEQQQQQGHQLTPVPVDHVFIEYDAVDSDSDTPAPPKAPEEVPQQQSLVPLAKPSLTIDISNGIATASSAAVMDTAANGNSAVHSPVQQQESPSSPERLRDRTSSRHEEIQSAAERRWVADTCRHAATMDLCVCACVADDVCVLDCLQTDAQESVHDYRAGLAALSRELGRGLSLDSIVFLLFCRSVDVMFFQLFGHSYSTLSAYSTDFSQSQVASSEFSSSSTTLPADVGGQQQQQSPGQQQQEYSTIPATLQDQYEYQLQHQQQQQQHGQEELDMQRLTRSMSSLRASQVRESQHLNARSISPIRPALEMNDLANEVSSSNLNGSANGNGVYSEDQLQQYQQQQQQQQEDSDYLSRHRTFSTTATNGYESETSGAIPYFTGSTSSTGFSTPVSATTPSNAGGGARRGTFSAENGGGGSNGRRQNAAYYQGNGNGSGGRRSSRQKSITISAAQFLQQQQTIAALIRQQQELKHIIGVLQEQQQQLMSVPVQLHELRLENAKGDGKDEMMRELYVQVDSLMRANDSLQVLVTQAEKETQDRAQEAEFLTEENDQLRARCDYFERKYIEEHKITFILEEEVQRFRMMSLTHELEQRNSVSQDASSSLLPPPPVLSSFSHLQDD